MVTPSATINVSFPSLCMVNVGGAVRIQLGRVLEEAEFAPEASDALCV
jgi:hypothetical protein